MELKTINDFESNVNSTVYLVDDTIKYRESDGIPYINSRVQEGRMYCMSAHWGSHPHHYEYNIQQLRGEHKYILDREFSVDEYIGVVDKHIHVFDNYSEAIDFITSSVLYNADTLKRLTKEIQEFTVTREQVAEAFNIPLNKLRIV